MAVDVFGVENHPHLYSKGKPPQDLSKEISKVSPEFKGPQIMRSSPDILLPYPKVDEKKRLKNSVSALPILFAGLRVARRCEPIPLVA